MSNTMFITANWTTGALSQQTISRQYDNNRYAVQFIGYPEGDGTEELDLYLLVWMSTAPGQKPGEITPIQLNSDQWYISNVFTQQTQQIKFQLCVLNEAGTYEAHSPIFTGFVRNSLEHDGTTQDIDVSTLFDAYREYLNELIIRADAVVIDPVPTQGSTNAVSSGGVKSALDTLQAQIPPIDPTLSQSGQAADAKKTGDNLSQITGNAVVNLITGKYIATNGDTANINSLVSNATYACAVLDCIEGDAFTVTGVGGNIPKLYAFLGAESGGMRPILQKGNQSLQNAYITAPTGTEKVVFNVNVNYDYLIIVGKNIVNTWAEIGETKTEISKIEKVIVFPNMADPSKFQQGYKTDTGKTYSSPTYMFTATMPVSEGDVLHITPIGRYLCAYDTNNSVVSTAGITSEYTEYTVPNGIGSVAVTFYAVNKDEFMVTKYAGLEYIPYGEPIISKDVLPEDRTKTPKLNYYRVSGDLSANQYLLIERKLPIKNLSVLQFNGNITDEFAGIEIGYTNDITQDDSTHFKIDAAKYYRVTSSPTEFEHKLTISGNVSITITQTYTNLMFDVVCNGQKFHTSSGWAPSNAMPYVKVLSDMTDCVLSFTASKNKKNIVVFGDSYVSYGESRWPYYLAEAEYDKNVTIIGYSGENSANGYQNFTDYMPISDAKYVVWAYGMNDQDTSSAINASWKEKIDAVIAYCESNNLTPVLCTVPNVPSRDNSLKNAYVRSFIGTRPVIDFAKAVGSDISTSWFSGMLSDDNVHPTAIGAMALYNRAIADFPQLCVDN